MFTCKLVFDDAEKKQQEIRRFPLKDATYASLLALITQTFGPGQYAVRYQDSDGDTLTVSSNAELEEAFRVAEAEKHTLKLVVSPASLGTPSTEFVSVQKPEEIQCDDEEHKYDDEHDELSEALISAERERIQSLELEDPKPTEKANPAPEPGPEPKPEPAAAAQQPAPEESKNEASEEKSADASAQKEQDMKRLCGLFADFLSEPAALASLPKAFEAGITAIEQQKPVKAVVDHILEAFGAIRAHPFLQYLLSETRVALFEHVLPEIRARVEWIKIVGPMLVERVVQLAPTLVESLRKFVAEWGSPDMSLDVDFGALPPIFAPFVGGFSSLFAGCPFTAKVVDENHPVHEGVRCDGCNGTIEGIRYKCTECPDFDLCESCEARNLHPSSHALVKYRRPANESEPPVPVHENVRCDGCNQLPIRGTRYKCSVCDDFDLCQPCESKGVHNERHPMIQMKIARRPHWGHGRGHGPFRHGGFGMFGPGCHQRRFGHGRRAPAPANGEQPASSPTAVPVSVPSPQVPAFEEPVAPVPVVQAVPESVPPVVAQPVSEPAVNEAPPAVALPQEVRPEVRQAEALRPFLAPFLGFLGRGAAQNPREQYAKELQTLKDMGFERDEVLLQLLQEHRGNVQRVALALLQ